jgi:hypothetical protein
MKNFTEVTKKEPVLLPAREPIDRLKIERVSNAGF